MRLPMFDKIGFRTSGLRHLPLKRVLDSIADSGFQTVEFCIEHPEASSGTIDYAREAGLEISAVSYHGKRDDNATRIENGEAAIRLAADCSVPVVVLGSPIDGRKEFLVESAELYRICRELGVKPAWETEPGTVLDGLDEFFEIIAPLGPSAGINLDAGHLHLQNRCTISEISSLAGRIYHVHVEGMKSPIHEHLIPGAGDLNWTCLLSGLYNAGYTGPLTIDLFDIPADWQEHLKKTNIALKSILDYM